AEDRHVSDETLNSLNAKLSELESVLGLIASPEVIKAYLALRGAKRVSSQQNGQLRNHLGRLIRVMRRDLVSSAPDSDENELLTVLFSEAVPPANLVDQRVGFPLARGPEDLRPRVFLTCHR